MRGARKAKGISRLTYPSVMSSEAFRECLYVVPDYQREYVWTEKEIQQLLDDVDEQLEVGDRKEYFIDTVLVLPTDQKNHGIYPS